MPRGKGRGAPEPAKRSASFFLFSQLNPTVLRFPDALLLTSTNGLPQKTRLTISASKRARHTAPPSAPTDPTDPSIPTPVSLGFLPGVSKALEGPPRKRPRSARRGGPGPNEDEGPPPPPRTTGRGAVSDEERAGPLARAIWDRGHEQGYCGGRGAES